MSESTESPVLVMAKPVGPRCNLACKYCYYVGKTTLVPREAPFRMSDRILEAYVSQRLRGAGGAHVHFEWHGGEPTLAGIEFYRRAVELQAKVAPADCTVTNGIQTNGALIDSEWVEFLREEGFSVGLSLDGPARLHDCFRVDRASGGSHAGAVRAFRLLQEGKVHTDVLCVLHARNVREPSAVYGFFRDLGVQYLQFLPLVERAPDRPGEVTDRTPLPEELGGFLCEVFDAWIAKDLGRMVVQTFDESLRPAAGMPHALCIFRETCGDAWVLEHDGGLYACDHFVDSEHRLGSLDDPGMAVLAGSGFAKAFGEAKRDSLPAVCRACDVLAWCNGGCPKDRMMDAEGQGKVNYLCAGYRAFFRHCRPVMLRLAEHWKQGKPLREFVVPSGPKTRAKRGRR